MLAPFLPKAAAWVKMRKETHWKGTQGPSIWFHCASLGEYEQAIPAIEKWKTAYPNWHVLVTFFSPSGYYHHQKNSSIDQVGAFMDENPHKISSFIQTHSIQIAVFVKYELWYNTLKILEDRKVSIFLMAAVFQENKDTRGFKKMYLQKVLPFFHAIFVQDKSSVKVLLDHFSISAECTGDPRYERVIQRKAHSVQHSELLIWKGHAPLLVAGSTWEAEEEAITKLLSLNLNLKLIVAPHDIHRSDKLYKKWNSFQPILYSNLDQLNSIHRLIIVDNIGQLFHLYALGEVALTGGGFRGALHNILEPAAWGKPVFFGNKTQKFPEAQSIEKAGGGISCSTPLLMAETINKYITHLQMAKKAGESALIWIEQANGASSKIVTSIQHNIKTK